MILIAANFLSNAWIEVVTIMPISVLFVKKEVLRQIYMENISWPNARKIVESRGIII